ncbi:MAG: hypothetical protein Q9191_003847 [Dirinaria sp. TL-2023a]
MSTSASREMSSPSMTTRQNGRAMSPTRNDEPDPRQSLKHVLTPNDAPVKRPRSKESSAQGKSSKAQKNMIWIHEGGSDPTETETSVQNDSYTRAAEVNPSYTMTVAHTRRNANGTVGSVYSGNKIRHLKKEDGIPLWRKDIQFSFLRAVFEDQTAVFTKAFDGTKGHTFADIYIDAMARSSKTSKILKEKLLSERTAALNMAMVCLLVNVGRMNTTLNFFPEMRAQLRTYHAIPCLQAHQDPIAYKQLQDAPRLKSILKGASEDVNQPNSLDKIKSMPIPRTNPVNLIFVLSQYAPKISETHFFPPRDFFDLVMRGTLSSKSRAKAFLWLIWFYLESDFSGHAAEINPFGPGQVGEGTGGLPLKVPKFDHLTEAQADAENVDTEAEKAYGERKRQERIRILEEDATVGPPLKKAKKGSNAPNDILTSDVDRTRSPSPAADYADSFYSVQRPAGVKHEVPGDSLPAFQPINRDVPYQGSDSTPSQRLVLKTRPYRIHGASPAPGRGSSQPPVNNAHGSGAGSRRSRPETSHQKAVNINRRMRIDRILFEKLTVEHRRVRATRKRQGRTGIFRAMRRIRNLPDNYDTEDEDTWGPGGLFPEREELEDYGEEATYVRKILDRAVRRLTRELNEGTVNGSKREHRKRKRKPENVPMNDGQYGFKPRKRSRFNEDDRRSRGGGRRRHEVADDGLDDLDLDLLGESREEEPLEAETEGESGGVGGGGGGGGEADSGDDMTEDETVEVA